MVGCGHGTTATGVLGLTLLVLGVISFPFIDWIIRDTIAKKVILRNGTEGFPLWQDPPIPIYLQVWMFNVENPDEVLLGGKPNVTQRGPYTYREHRKKVDLSYHENGTVSYRQIKLYHFIRNMSVSWDNETFTTINIPYMTLVSGFQWRTPLMQKTISFLLNVLFPKEGVFMKRTVREIVWGYTDPILHAAKLLDPKTFTTDFIGVLMNRNSTDDGIYTVYTGEKNIHLLGVIDKYNGAKSVKYWSSPSANMVNGTDGSIGPPFINSSFVVWMFSTDICRSIYGLYQGTVKTLEDITLYRFTSPRAAMASAAINPANAGFCTPAGNCLGTGVLNISTCQIIDTYHLPVVASAPHFYLADKKFVDAVIGMEPDAKQHATYVDIEPNSGFVMQVYKRLQISVSLKKDPNFKKTSNLPEVIHPVLWVNESAVTDEAHAHMIKQELLVPKRILHIVRYVILGLGCVITMGTILFLIIQDMRSPKERNDENMLTADDEGIYRGD